METANFLQQMMQQVVLGINTCYPAKILSFNIEQQEATIQPLFQTKEYGQPSQTQPILEDVPVLRMRYQERTEGGAWGQTIEHRAILKKGDIVMCTVAQRSLDDVEEGVPYTPSKARVMNMQDSVIVGVLNYV